MHVLCSQVAVAPFFGNSVACRIAEAHAVKHSTLVLGDWRAAQRIEFLIAPDSAGGGGGGSGGSSSAVQNTRRPGWRRGGSDGSGSSCGGERSSVFPSGARAAADSGEDSFMVWVCNTHLDHDHWDTRQRQALAVCSWMEEAKRNGGGGNDDSAASASASAVAAIVLCGDFNGAPHEPLHAALRARGYASAHVAATGHEPQARTYMQACLPTLHPCSLARLPLDLSPFPLASAFQRFAIVPAPHHTPAPPCDPLATPAPRPPAHHTPAPPLHLHLQGTWPTGIEAPLRDHGEFECLDYVYVWAAPGFDVQ